MPASRTDYAATYFPYSSPTPIQGEPTYKAVKRLKNELRANASSVDSDLGGGDHGYLGLILSDAEYASICPTSAFIAPAFPGQLLIPRGTDTIDAINIREAYKRDMNLYRECRDVERALMKHITVAVEPKYIDFLKNEHTDLIEEDIPTVLEYLFSNYGKVPTRQVKEKEQEVLSTPFVPSDPMITIFRPIEQLRNLAKIAKIPYTESQIVDFGIQLIKNTRDFETALGDWNRKLQHNKSWDEFKEHFQIAQSTLKDIRGPTMAQAGYHHANLLASEIRNELQNNQMQMLSLMKMQQEEFPEEHFIENETENINATPYASIQTETLKALQELQKGLKYLTSEVKQNGHPTRGKINKKTADNATFNRTETGKYCWTHGACNHNSNECNRKAPGHKSDATKDNKIGGSKAFCN